MFCIFIFAPVQRNWACFTWKGALELHSLYYYYYYYYYYHHHHPSSLRYPLSASGAEDPGFESRLRRDFFRVESYQWLKIGTPVATLPGAWYFRVNAGTDRPGVSILWLREVESLICNFYLSVSALKIVQICPWDTLACCWTVKQPIGNFYLSVAARKFVHIRPWDTLACCWHVK